MLLVDKYRPRSLADFELHKDVADNLRKLVAGGDLPHLLFYGPSGAGKKTLILALLRELYGPGVEKLKVEVKPWKLTLPSRVVEVEFATVSSAHHLEMNPSDVGPTHDRHVVQEVIKEVARSRPVGAGAAGAGGGAGASAGGGAGFRVLVLDEVDRLSRDAQHALRRTMEKYSGACRLVLTGANVSKVIEPLRSRCLCVRVAAPAPDAVAARLGAVAAAEGLALPHAAAERLAAGAGRSLRRALLSLEAAAAAGPLTEATAPAAADWEAYVAEIAGDMLAEQSPRRLYQVRGKLYELLVNCVPPEVVLRRLALELLRRTDDELRRPTAAAAAAAEHRLQRGAKAIFHLEAFAARFMSDYKNYMASLMG